MANQAYRDTHKKEKQEYDKRYYESIKANKRVVWLKKSSDRRKNYQARKLYGISPEQKLSLLKSQNGGCAICGEGNNGKELDIDHVHDENKKIRGLLCRRCNHGLGNFRDNQALLLRAAEYLNK